MQASCAELSNFFIITIQRATMEMLCEQCADLFRGECGEDLQDRSSYKTIRCNSEYSCIGKLSNADGCFLCHRVWQHLSLESLLDQSEYKSSTEITIDRSLLEYKYTKSDKSLSVEVEVSFHKRVKVELYPYSRCIVLDNGGVFEWL